MSVRAGDWDRPAGHVEHVVAKALDAAIAAFDAHLGPHACVQGCPGASELGFQYRCNKASDVLGCVRELVVYSFEVFGDGGMQLTLATASLSPNGTIENSPMASALGPLGTNQRRVLKGRLILQANGVSRPFRTAAPVVAELSQG